MGKWRYSSSFLDLGTRWRRVVSFTPLPLYPRKKSPRYPLDRRLGGLQSRSGRCGEEKNLALQGIEPEPSSPSLYRLSYDLVEIEKQDMNPQSEENIFNSKEEQFMACILLLISRTDTSRFGLRLVS
jgi:hypothetical protein